MKNQEMVKKLANELGNDMEQVRKELRKVQSIKCNLKKNKHQKDYSTKMTSILNKEELLKQVRSMLEPQGKKVTTFTQEDVDQLTYDECVKAIRSIQSKKTHTRWLTENEGDNDEYRRACEIEKMLMIRRQDTKPLDESVVSKHDVQTIIDELDSNNLSTEQVKNLLSKLM